MEEGFSMADAPITESVRTRRAVLAAAAGSAAALAVSTIRPPSVAAVAAPMLTETDNATTAPTGVTNATAGSDGFFANAAGAGIGSTGASAKGIGVVGTSADTTDPVTNATNAGVVGVAGDIGSIATEISLTGVYGFSDPSPVPGHVGAGVWGSSDDFGVFGDGGIGVFGDGFIGVLGVAENAAGVGVQAETAVAGARSLRVVGRAEFTRSGRTTIAAGKSSKAVSLSGCTTSTLVLAVLSTNRSGRYVRAVVPAAGKFTIYLNTTVPGTTGVTWIAFTNPSNHSG
jgi:hypothetical protein